jgi:spore coat polysaccharide biosynthesis protein SpsF (cytidylyltransferase family)
VPCSEDLSQARWTLDTAADYRMLRAVVAALGSEAAVSAGWRDIRDVLSRRPDIAEMNSETERDAGLAKSIELDKLT